MNKYAIVLVAVVNAFAGDSLNACCKNQVCDENGEIINIPKVLSSQYQKYLVKTDTFHQSGNETLIQFTYQTHKSKLIISYIDSIYGLADAIIFDNIFPLKMGLRIGMKKSELAKESQFCNNFGDTLSIPDAGDAETYLDIIFISDTINSISYGHTY